MARKFADTVAEEKQRNKGRAEKLFEPKEEPKRDDAPKGKLLEDITAGGSNGPSYADYRHWFQKLKVLKAKVREANSEYSNARKGAKDAGIDPSVLSYLMKRQEQDPLEVEIYHKQLVRAGTAVGIEVQMDLFDRSNISREAQIFDDGVKAGAAAKNTSDNPHNENTDAGQTWLAGWHAGQRRNLAKIAASDQDGGEAPTAVN